MYGKDEIDIKKMTSKELVEYINRLREENNKMIGKLRKKYRIK